jgi:hypothetical protein
MVRAGFFAFSRNAYEMRLLSGEQVHAAMRRNYTFSAS